MSNLPPVGGYQAPPIREQSQLGVFFHLLAVVAVVTLAAHLPVLKCGAEFFDDREYVIGNPLVQDLGLGSAKRFFTEIFNPSTVHGYYQPLTMVSLMLDYALIGQSGNLYGFHRTSLMFHVANTVLLSVLLYLLFQNPWAAAISGLLFGIHPVTAETVAWISERKTLLASFFSLFSLICYVLHAQKNQRRFYACSVLMYAMALLCKPTAVMLPIVMILLDIWPLKRFSGVRRMMIGKVSLLVICVLSAVVTYVSQSHSAGVHLPTEYSLGHGPLILCHNVPFYLHKIFWPLSLSPFYPYPEPFALLNPKVFPHVTGTVVILILLAVSLRWSRAITVGFLIFFFAILPTMQIIGFSTEIAANRFLYLPSLGLLLLLAWFSAWLLRRNRAQRTIFSRWALVVTFMIVAVAEIHYLRIYLAQWRDTRTLSEYMLKITPYEHKVHNTLGVALLEQGKVSEAISHFKLATRFAGDPVRGVRAYTNLGRVLIQAGNTRLGLDFLRKVAYGCPKYYDASLYLAWILATHPDPNVVASEEAVRLTEPIAEATDEHVVVVLDTLAAAYAANDQFEEAIQTAKKALNLCTAKKVGPLTEKIQRRIESYRNRQRYCEDPTVAAWAKAWQ